MFSDDNVLADPGETLINSPEPDFGPRDEIFLPVEGLNSNRRMELIADGMAERGHPDARIEKVIGGNWMRLFGEVWNA